MRLPLLLAATSLALFGSSSFSCAQDTQANTTEQVVANGMTTTETPANETTLPGISIQGLRPIIRTCVQPAGVVSKWWYNTRSDGPYSCYWDKQKGEWPWTMLNVFQWGGTEGVHWKYTNDVNDPACLYNFKIFSADGQNHVATSSGRTTTYGLNRRWCALPVYRSGGVRGKQWTQCDCQSIDDGVGGGGGGGGGGGTIPIPG